MKSRELDFGWVQTINGLDEKSFPLFIKQVSMKELAVIFPSALVAIMFFSRNMFISMAALVPAMYVIFYEEKSMNPFQYVYYFLRYYLLSTKTPVSKNPTIKSKVSQKKLIHFNLRIIMKYKVDIITLLLGVILDFAGIRFLSVSFQGLLVSLILLSIGTALILSEILIIQTQRMKKEKQKSKLTPS
ncbi:hypothetical protein V6M85_13880 [Sulfolobus tengchongensis]|uniref:Uncharacterized protein n=1 Tax=Sulfolobus tengchongensis TaxID=207809 RepID=A0AAX4L0P0_9CREN